jgi:hypothetical protein
VLVVQLQHLLQLKVAEDLRVLVVEEVAVEEAEVRLQQLLQNQEKKVALQKHQLQHQQRLHLLAQRRVRI